MKIKEENWYGLDHAEINIKVEGSPDYIRSFMINGHVWAVYKSDNPNRENGHKDYVMLSKTGDGRWFISGKDKADMEEWKLQSAIHCLLCDTVLYSITGHHYHKCGCANETMVDGGRNYLRYGGRDMTLVKPITLDLIMGAILPYRDDDIIKDEDSNGESLSDTK
jgi:hypothetical protein